MDGLVTWQASMSRWSNTFSHGRSLPMPVRIMPGVWACFQIALRLSTSQEECSRKARGLRTIVIAYYGQNIAQRWHATHLDESAVVMLWKSKTPKPQLSMQRLHLRQRSWSTLTRNSLVTRLPGIRHHLSISLSLAARHWEPTLC